MKKIISNNKTMVCISISLFLIGFLHSVIVKDFIWFQRIGAIIVCVGILLLSRPSLINQSLLSEVGMANSPFNSNDPEHYKFIGEPVPEIVSEDSKSRIAVNKLGPLITFIGTVIWGYGDLINRLCF